MDDRNALSKIPSDGEVQKLSIEDFDLIRREIAKDDEIAAAPSRNHQNIVGGLFVDIRNWISGHHMGYQAYVSPFDVKLPPNNTTVEPDISVILNGTGRYTDAGYEGYPEWVIEVTSPGNRYYDFHEKYDLYRTAGVSYYWIVDLAANEWKTYICNFRLREPNILTYWFNHPAPVDIFPGMSVVINNYLN